VKNSNALISIVMPVYNVEAYIKRSIESVLGQSYENFELIIVDDGSIDGSIDIAEKYQENDSRIKIVRKTNGGLSDARNHGIACVNGDYLIFIDSDDYWDKNLLSSTLSFSEQKDLDLVIFGYHADLYDSNDKLIRRIDTVEQTGVINRLKPDSVVSIKNVPLLGYAWNKLYRTSLILDNKVIFQKGTSYIEDILFNVRVFEFAKKVGFYNKALYHYSQYDRETLGVKYYKDMALLDKTANKAFSDALTLIGVDESAVSTFATRNIYEKARWSTSIVAKSSKINRATKLSEISEVANNIEDAKGVARTVIDRIYLALFKYKLNKLLLLVDSIRSRSLKRYVLDLIPNRFKAELKYVMSHKGFYRNLTKNEKKVIVLLAADYGNLGDVAITYAQKKFLEVNLPDHKLVTLTVSETYSNLKSLKRVLSPADIITTVGGGNMGDMYEDIEEQRRFIVRKLKRNRIVSFPQTIDFSESPKGIKSLRRTVSIYNSHKRLVLLAREAKTQLEMSSLFNAPVFLTPDIVLSLDESSEQEKRIKSSAVLCIRQDDESSLSVDQRVTLSATIYKTYKNVEVRDTHIGDVRLNEVEASQALESIWASFRKAELVVTDRLHGMIFCAITKTPCIALNNSNGKVKGVYDLWLKRLSGVILIDEFSQESLELALEEIRVVSPENTKKISSEFDSIREVLL